MRIALLTVGILAAAMIAISSRWQIEAGGEDLGVYRLDRWTGAVVRCGIPSDESGRVLDLRARGVAVPRIEYEC